MEDMKIIVGIACVDGSEETLQTTKVVRAQSFLKERDHEGSSISVTIEMNNEAAYKLLQLVISYS